MVVLLRLSRQILVCLLLLSGGATEVLGQTVQGYNMLAIGHSFFRPFADGLAAHAERAGVVGHTQTVVFSGGASGAPLALWNNATKSAQIKAALDTGEIDLFGMTYEPTYPTTEGYENWIDYALANNPDTKFFIGLPWADFPAAQTTEEYTSFWLAAHETAWHAFVDSIKALYPGVEIFCLPYGQSAIELRVLFEEGNLPDVSSLIGAAGQAIFTDNKGHAGNILKDTGRLVWLRGLYGIALETYDWDHGYITDIKGIASAIMDEHDLDFPRDIDLAAIRSTKFMLRDDARPPLDPNKRRFSFRSSPYKGDASGVTAPEFGTAGDPTAAGESGGGATLTLYSSSDYLDEAVQLSLPASRWKRTGSAANPGYRYKDSRGVDGPIQKITLRNGKLSITGRGAGLYSLEDAPQGKMVLRLKLGSKVEFCATAAPRSPAVQNDTTAKFNGDKASPAPAACPPLIESPYGSVSEALLAAPSGLAD